jgi:hypothetical protein
LSPFHPWPHLFTSVISCWMYLAECHISLSHAPPSYTFPSLYAWSLFFSPSMEYCGHPECLQLSLCLQLMHLTHVCATAPLAGGTMTAVFPTCACLDL